MRKIAPSLLAANMLRLEQEIESILAAGADLIHLDIMDQHYVPNLSFGPAFCKQVRERFPTLILDVHLMINHVHEMIESFAKAGATRISIHPDACHHLDRELAFIRELDCEAGLAINPATSIDCLEQAIHRLDYVLVMTVNPGFGGQRLIRSCVSKISAIHERYPDLPITVDGGVNIENIATLAKAGAETFVVGAGLFGRGDEYKQTMKSLRQ